MLLLSAAAMVFYTGFKWIGTNFFKNIPDLILTHTVAVKQRKRRWRY
jgi:hypothetical protein